MGDLLRHSFSDLLTTGSPPGGIRGDAPDEGDDALDLAPLSRQKKTPGVPPRLSFYPFPFLSSRRNKRNKASKRNPIKR